MAEITDIFKGIFFKPSNFFDSVAGDESYIKPLLYYSLCFIVSTILASLISITIQLMISPVLGITSAFAALLGFFVWMPSYLILPFIISGLSHLGLRLFGARGKFINTFRPVSYSSIVFIVYMTIFSMLHSITLIFMLKEFLISIS